ncbi:hypothetical protein CAI21_20270 [Alkalilimnicola ehrlichii]|uniref:Outer membrane protein assembly factor BamC n=1 Tax=Alkalilimnicola ehrlichii TaxID=351052 RepID=A0A3E0WGP7_9GAMM|nr:hypothetical protein CAI21_20270 [Alkalilimnicola ehrlichii]RFA32064.1 hypothetical protein CAL65_20730 [Alkalilimnicola ehrlichii]
MAILGISLASGCGVFRGDPDPAQERAERLQQPPVLAPERDAAERPGLAQPESMPPENGLAAEQETRSKLADGPGEAPMLVIEEGFFEAWRQVGTALDRAGFTVEDRDRSAGAYYIRYDVRAEEGQRERGFFSFLAFWRSEEPDSLRPYVVNLSRDGRRTQVFVSDEDGEYAEPEISERILVLLQEHLR